MNVRKILGVILTALMANQIATAQTLPFDIIKFPNEIPLEIIAGMESRPGTFAFMQVDTGSPTNSTFNYTNEPKLIDDRFQIISKATEPPIFVGDTGRRLRIKANDASSRFELDVAVIETASQLKNHGRRSGSPMVQAQGN